MKLTKRQLEIIDAAQNLAASGGIQNLTVRNIGDQLKISEPAIYRHFPSKSAIIRALIGRFDQAVAVEDPNVKGFEAIIVFARGRFQLASANPALARLMFAEEMFMDDPEFTRLMMEMMHRHKAALERHFAEAVDSGEVRGDLSGELLFRIVMGPVRLLIKQWGMTGRSFDLTAKGEELLAALRLLLQLK